MSFLLSLIIPLLEKELVGLEPQVAAFLATQAKQIGTEVAAWAEAKLHITDTSQDVSQL